jgi:glutamate formiminotransferase
VGSKNGIKDAIVTLADQCIELIDINQWNGEHPTIGALDMVPIAPLYGVDLEDCKVLADELGELIYRKFRIPIYFTSESAKIKERKDNAVNRRGWYKGLKYELEVLKKIERTPDIGEQILHPTAGAVTIGAVRYPLVAVNVYLNTNEEKLARDIARAISGTKGGFSTVRSRGFIYKDRGACICFDLNDYKLTPIHRVVELIKTEAFRYGLKVLNVEIVGPIPLDAICDVAKHYLQLLKFDLKQILELNFIDWERDFR